MIDSISRRSALRPRRSDAISADMVGLSANRTLPLFSELCLVAGNSSGNLEWAAEAQKVSQRNKRTHQASAITAMDTFMPGTRTGNFAPCRAGGFVGNHLIHSSFIPAKSGSSRTMTVALTTRSSDVPADLRMADT